MMNEMEALHSSDTLVLLSLPSRKSVIGSQCVFTIKVSPDDQIDRLKARFVAEGYTKYWF